MLKTFTGICLAASLTLSTMALAQSNTFDSASKTFRLDGGNVTYVFGVNPRGELQQLYWGARLGAGDRFPQAQPMPEWSSFDGSYT
ncbi:MAG: alpha-galactosidase, partial [Terracidiphilus sp.]